MSSLEEISENYLPLVDKVPRGFIKGRSVYEGYQRGWGLKNGLDVRIGADPDFYETAGLIRDRCLTSEDRLKNLFMLLRFFLREVPSGDIIEFGSFRGGSAMFMALLAKKFLPGVTVFGLDTFSGMPDTGDLDMHTRGDFAFADLVEVNAAKDALGLDNLVFVKGLFEDTTADCVKGRRFALAHIDADIYSSCAFAYDAIRPYVVSKGYFVFDDATEPSCIGATQVVEELVVHRDGLLSEQISPHFVYRAP